MHIGIAYDLKTDFQAAASGPDDALEEYDSPATVDGIERALRARGHTVTKLGGGRKFLAAVLEAPPELVFNISEGHGSRSREAHVPAVCEMLKIPHTHSDPLTMSLALDKAMAKRLVAIAGVPTPRFAVIESARDLASLSLEFPLFAKPLFEVWLNSIMSESLRVKVTLLFSSTILPRVPVISKRFVPGASPVDETNTPVALFGHSR